MSKLTITCLSGFTPDVAMDFRSLLHKLHMGKEQAQGSSYQVIGVFLGVPIR
jgi:hypothetical protein